MLCFVVINSILLNFLSVWTLQLRVLPCLARGCHSVTFGESVSVRSISCRPFLAMAVTVVARFHFELRAPTAVGKIDQQPWCLGDAGWSLY